MHGRIFNRWHHGLGMNLYGDYVIAHHRRWSSDQLQLVGMAKATFLEEWLSYLYGFKWIGLHYHLQFHQRRLGTKSLFGNNLENPSNNDSRKRSLLNKLFTFLRIPVFPLIIDRFWSTDAAVCWSHTKISCWLILSLAFPIKIFPAPEDEFHCQMLKISALFRVIRITDSGEFSRWYDLYCWSMGHELLAKILK
jgi:hypothetical protein